MHTTDLPSLAALPMGVRCRPAQASDAGFLRQLYAATRAQDLALLHISPAMLDGLIDMQFDAQRRHYTQSYPGCMPWVIEQDAQPVGQLWLHLKANGLRLLDISVLPTHRRQGIGSICIGALLALADRHGWRMHLHVLTDNPVRQWYARLGFAATHITGLHLAMTRPAVNLETRYEQA